jgi:hypothetical protein
VEEQEELADMYYQKEAEVELLTKEIEYQKEIKEDY